MSLPMEWSMPPKVLKVVAGVLAVAAVGSFSLGVLSAPHRGRLPGERAGGDTAGTLLQATEATPLSQERIEGPPPPRELTEAEKAKLEADKLAKAEAEAAQKLAAAEAAPKIAPPPPGDRVGDLLDSVTPPPVAPADDPPH